MVVTMIVVITCISKCKQLTHCGLQLALCCVVMTDDERAVCHLNAVIHYLQLSGSEFCSVGGFHTLSLVVAFEVSIGCTLIVHRQICICIRRILILKICIRR